MRARSQGHSAIRYPTEDRKRRTLICLSAERKLLASSRSYVICTDLEIVRTIEVAVVGAGVSTVVAVHEQRASVAIVPVIAAIVAARLMVSSMARWLRGESFPVTDSVLAWVVSVPALVIFLWFDRAVGGVYVAGLATGCMVANVWAIRVARRNRPDVRR